MDTLARFVVIASLFVISACCSAPTPATPPADPPADPIGETRPADPIPSDPGVVGPADPTGAITCGGMTGAACPAGSFCQMDGHCGAADVSGTCQEIRPMCTRDYRPVCGCDGKTYGNRCTAHAAGVSVLSDGECPATP